MGLTQSEKFKDYIISSRYIGHPQTLYKFPNGYGASVIEFYHYGFEEERIEIAVVHFDNDGKYHLDYSTPITDDVICGLDIEERDNVLQRIFDLKEDSNA